MVHAENVGNDCAHHIGSFVSTGAAVRWTYAQIGTEDQASEEAGNGSKNREADLASNLKPFRESGATQAKTASGLSKFPPQNFHTTKGRMLNQNTYVTQNLTVAAYLMASEKLSFIRAQRIGRSSRVEFVFGDPQGLGGKLEAEVLKGAAWNVVRFYDALRDLRSRMNVIWHAEENHARIGY